MRFTNKSGTRFELLPTIQHLFPSLYTDKKMVYQYKRQKNGGGAG